MPEDQQDEQQQEERRRDWSYRNERSRSAVPKEIGRRMAYGAMFSENIIRKHLDLKEMVAKLETQVEDMRNRYLHYPPGTRPFRSLEEQAELDEPFKVSSQQAWLFQVIVDAGTSLTTAMHLVHHVLIVFVKQCYLESAYDAVERTRSGIEKKAWYAKVEDLWEEATKRNDVSELGLEQPMLKDLNRELFLQKAEELYGRVIQHVHKDEKAWKDEKAEDTTSGKGSNSGGKSAGKINAGGRQPQQQAA